MLASPLTLGQHYLSYRNSKLCPLSNLGFVYLFIYLFFCVTQIPLLFYIITTISAVLWRSLSTAFHPIHCELFFISLSTLGLETRPCIFVEVKEVYGPVGLLVSVNEQSDRVQSLLELRRPSKSFFMHIEDEEVA